MKDMIAEIVNVDKKERELTEELQHSKVNVEQEISIMREKIREDYLTRARKRIELNKKTEKEAANKVWQSIKRKQTKISKTLDKVYEENCSDWVDTIVKNVIGE